MFISIPAPARGRTLMLSPGFKVKFYFNSRPREGANRDTGAKDVNTQYFNSRPREGANPPLHSR